MRKTTRQFFTLAITVQMLAGLGSSFAQTAATGTNWAAQDFNALQQRNIIITQGQTAPNAWLTRSEFVDLTARALGLTREEALDKLDSLENVSDNDWKFTTIQQVSSQDIVPGYPNPQFQPGNPVRRAEVITVFAEAIESPEPSRTQANQLLSRYTDASQLPSWARDEAAELVYYNVFENNPTRTNLIDPARPVTRAEVAAMLNNMLSNSNLALAGSPPGAATTTLSKGTTTTTTTTRTTTMTTGTPSVIATPSATAVPTTIPAQTLFTTVVATPVFSEFSRVGDPVTVILEHPLMSSDGRIIVPSGSKINGEVVAVQNADKNWENALVDIRFNEIVTPSDQHLLINGTVATTDGRLHGEDLNARILFPSSSLAALESQMNSVIGGTYGTVVGKSQVYDETVIESSNELLTRDKSQREVLLGVGDKLQIKLNNPVAVNWLAK